MDKNKLLCLGKKLIITLVFTSVFLPTAQAIDNLFLWEINVDQAYYFAVNKKYFHEVYLNYIVNEYLSPLGAGYEIIEFYEYDGKKFMETIAYGPEKDSRTTLPIFIGYPFSAVATSSK